MLLEKLKEYAEKRMTMPPQLYAEAPVRYILELGPMGRSSTPQLIDTADASSRRTKRGQYRPVPQVQRTSDIRPLLLADKADYVLGYVGPKGKERVDACHAAFLELLGRCARETEEPTVLAVERFLQNNPLGQLERPEDFDPGGIITFSVDGVFPVDLPSVQEFWAQENALGGDSATIMQCLICGEEKPVAERLQEKIKRVPGGQTSGTTIIGMNAPAFESYGLSASLNAPTCAGCGEAFTKAANHLLASETNCLRLNKAAYLFWTREEVEFDFKGLIDKPEVAQVRNLLSAVWSSNLPSRTNETAFYSTVLSGSGGRAVVRDWIDTTVGDVRRHLALWFQRQSIVMAYGEEWQPLGLNALAYATVREPKDLPTPVPRALLRGALLGTPLPMDLLYRAVRRNRAEQGVTRPRAALIKLVLMSQQTNHKEDEMVQLDPETTNPAYRCGRLLAVLEDVQTSAIKGINTTVADRFYGAASTAPGTVFPRMLQVAKHHLTKLKRDRRGAYYALQEEMEGIIDGIQNFPSSLNLEKQGMFALGYYHQLAHNRAQRRERAELREAKDTNQRDKEVE